MQGLASKLHDLVTDGGDKRQVEAELRIYFDMMKEQFSSLTIAPKADSKGSKGTTGWILFGKENKEKHAAMAKTSDYKNMSTSSIASTFWKAMTDAEKSVWDARAADINEANGKPLSKAQITSRLSSRATSRATSRSASPVPKVVHRPVTRSMDVDVVMKPVNDMTVEELEAAELALTEETAE